MLLRFSLGPCPVTLDLESSAALRGAISLPVENGVGFECFTAGAFHEEIITPDPMVYKALDNPYTYGILRGRGKEGIQVWTAPEPSLPRRNGQNRGGSF